jgi:CRP-like cAMP-binding protein
MFVIRAGRVDILNTLADREPLATLQAGDNFGETALLSAEGCDVHSSGCKASSCVCVSWRQHP